MQNETISISALRLRIGVLAGMALLAIFYAAARFSLSVGGTRIDYSPGSLAGSPALVSDIAVAVVILAMFRLTQMLALIAKGDRFSVAVIARFRAFAFWLMVVALIGLLAPLVAGLLGAREPGAGGVEIPIHVRDVLTLGITLVLFLLARLLERARELEQEVSEFL